MAGNTPNLNLLIIGGVVIGGLYFYNKIKESTPGGTSRDYVSGVTGSNISDATPRTIMLDIRQAGRTDRADIRNLTDMNRQEEVTDRIDLRQAGRTKRAKNRQDTRVELAQNRQESRAEIVATRQSARTTRQENTINLIKSVGGAVLNTVRSRSRASSSPNTSSASSRAVTPGANYSIIKQSNPYAGQGFSSRFIQ